MLSVLLLLFAFVVSVNAGMRRQGEKRIFAELLGPQSRVVDAAEVGAKSIICESENVGCGKVLYT